MVKAFKCDHCREFYDPYSPKMVTRTSGAVHVGVTIIGATVGQQPRDYCKDCLLKVVLAAFDE
ncbi:hypothetical protein LCGC14_1003130 [marine sediment metagenome]|uniref:Uncharacterized protein n=1 Tax=marine sediment metagenome TaxID=412755 RepID=A0A0F9R8M6_9ZZZZ